MTGFFKSLSVNAVLFCYLLDTEIKTFAPVVSAQKVVLSGK